MFNPYNNRGIALFISLALLLLLSMVAVTFLITSYNSANINESLARRARALTVAEAGINYAFWKIRIGEDDAGDPITYPCTLTPPVSRPPGWTVPPQVKLEKDAVTGRITIRSKVVYPKATVFQHN